MTGYTVHTGSTEAFADNYDRIFGGKKTAKKQKSAEKKMVKITAKKKLAPRK